jgi:hypothetical protein
VYMVDTSGVPHVSVLHVNNTFLKCMVYYQELRFIANNNIKHQISGTGPNFLLRFVSKCFIEESL